MKKLTRVLLVTLLAMTVVLTGCGSSSSKDKKTDEGSQGPTFTVKITENEKGYTGGDKKVIDSKEITIEGENTNLITYLRENFDIVDDNGYIKEIKGVKAMTPIADMTEDQKKNEILGREWFIYIDGEKADKGANDIIPKAGQEITVDIHDYNNSEFK